MKILVVCGTRPEVIKLAPVIHALQAAEGVECFTCLTGQHTAMVRPMLEFLEVEAHFDLEVMQPEQTLASLTARMLERLPTVLDRVRPDLVIVQGDTTTAFAAGLCAFYRGQPVGHVEAGLRTGDRKVPFPEEINRRFLSLLADLHFAPTATAEAALLAEGVPADRVFVTGNTAIDTLLSVAGRVDRDPPPVAARLAALRADPTRPFVLFTAHRRESFGAPFEEICHALRDLAALHVGVDFVFPVHLNPNVQRPVRAVLSGVPNVILLEPLPYADFVWLLARCRLVVTDSGGIQEEAPSLGKHVLVMRELTERTEGLAAGLATLVGVRRERIVEAVRARLGGGSTEGHALGAANPYGDGRAAERIAAIVASRCWL